MARSGSQRANPPAVSCRRSRKRTHGKEGVDGSSPSEGFATPLSGSVGTGTVYAYAGRFHLGMSLIKLTAHGHTSGTFRGREPLGATRRFTGSYHC